METKSFQEFQIADISASSQAMIRNLEEVLSQQSDKDIVLIAYQPVNKKC